MEEISTEDYMELVVSRIIEEADKVGIELYMHPDADDDSIGLCSTDPDRNDELYEIVNLILNPNRRKMN